MKIFVEASFISNSHYFAIGLALAALASIHDLIEGRGIDFLLKSGLLAIGIACLIVVANLLVYQKKNEYFSFQQALFYSLLIATALSVLAAIYFLISSKFDKYLAAAAFVASDLMLSIFFFLAIYLGPRVIGYPFWK